MAPERRPESSTRVGLVSSNRATLASLEDYLRGAGVVTLSTGDIGRVTELRSAAAAIVVFPDDFDFAAVVRALEDYRKPPWGGATVLVTSNPGRFNALEWTNDLGPPLIVPKPAWSWIILDAIHACLREQRERHR